MLCVKFENKLQKQMKNVLGHTQIPTLGLYNIIIVIILVKMAIIMFINSQLPATRVKSFVNAQRLIFTARCLCLAV